MNVSEVIERIMATLGLWAPIAALIAVMGLGGVLRGLHRIMKAQNHSTWTPINAQVDSTSIERTTDDGSKVFFARVHYSYVVDDELYQSTERVVHTGNGGFSTEAEAQNALEIYPRHSKFPVYVNPRNPRDCVIRPGDTRGGWDLVLPSLFFFGMAVWTLWRASKGER